MAENTKDPKEHQAAAVAGALAAAGAPTVAPTAWGHASKEVLLEKALEKLRAAKEAYTRGFSESHPKLAAPWEGIAKALLGLRRFDEARDAALSAIAIREKFLPVDPQSGQRPFNKDLEAAHKLIHSIEAKLARE